MIEGLDALDRIKILGVSMERLSFADASVHGLSGVGIFADGILEALYTGGDLNTTNSVRSTPVMPQKRS